MTQLRYGYSLFLAGSALLLAVASAGATGCNAILGLEPGEPPAASGEAEGAGGGSGGAGGGSALCEPGAVAACYTGPEATKNVGQCREGQMVCLEDGSGYGACEGESLPAVEACGAATGDANCNGFARSDLIFGERFGDVGTQVIEAAATDAEGNVIFAGEFEGTIDFGGGPLDSAGMNDVFIVKLSQDGHHLWSHRYGNANDQQSLAVAVDGDGNVIVTGTFDGTIDFGGETLISAGGKDVFLAKLNRDGEHIWSKNFGDGSDQIGKSIAVDAKGNVALCGSFFGTMNFGTGSVTSAGSFDIFLASFEASGKHRWSKRFGDTNAQECEGVAAGADGSVFITGSFTGSVGFGKTPLTSVEKNDIYVAKFGADGAIEWNQAFGGVNQQLGRALAVTPDGGVVVVGTFLETVNFGGGPLTTSGFGNIFVAKLDATGTHVFSKGFGDENFQGVEDVAVDTCGDVLITGTFNGKVDFGGGALEAAGLGDIYVAKLGPKGEYVWAKSYGDESDQYGTAIAVSPMGHMYAAGYFSGAVNMGEKMQTKEGDTYDALVARFEP